MENNEEIFNKLGLVADKYAKSIDFLSQEINGCRHHQHLWYKNFEWIKKERDKGNLFNLPPIGEYPGDFQMDWESLKTKRRRELNTYGESLSTEQKIELMQEFHRDLRATKNNYLKLADSETIVKYYQFLEKLNTELGL